MRPKLFALLLCGLFGFSSTFQAQTLLKIDGTREKIPAYKDLLYYRDAPGELNLDLARRKLKEGAFKPENGQVPHHGWTPDDFWFAFALEGTRPDFKRWFLAIEYPNMDWIEIHFVMPDGTVIEKQTGDRRPFTQRDIQSSFFYIEIPTQIAPGPIEVFIHARASAVMTMPLYVQEMSAIMRADHNSQIFFGLIIGSMLIMAFYYLLIGLHTLNLEQIFLSLFFLFAMFYRMSFQGLVFEYAFPQYPNFSNVMIPLSGSLVLLWAALFVERFFDLQNHRRFFLINRLAIFGSALFVALSPILEYGMIRQLVAFGVLASCSWMFIGIAKLKRGFKPARFFLMAWGTPFLGWMAFNFSLWGFLPQSIGMKAFDVSLIGQILFFSFATSEKIRELNRSKKIAQEEALLAQIEARRATDEMNVKLEEEVQARTRQLWNNTQEMQVILDNVQQGICTLDESLIIQPKYSRQMIQFIHDQPIKGSSILTAFFAKAYIPIDRIEGMKAALQSFWNADRIDFELNAHLLPKDLILLKDESRLNLELDWAPIMNSEDSITAVLLSIKDVTELKKVEAAAHSQKRELEMVGRIIVLPSIKMNLFLENAEVQLKMCRQEVRLGFDEQRWLNLLRFLHTIKGNARTYGFYDLSSDVHACEDRLLKLQDRWQDPESPALSLEVLDTVARAVSVYRHVNDSVLNRRELAGIEKAFGRFSEAFLPMWSQLDPIDRQRLLPHVAELNRLLVHRFHDLISQLAASLDKLAEQLQKKCPRVRVSGDDFDVRPEQMPQIESIFMHMFRNGLDHGFEADEAGEIRIEIRHDRSRTVMIYSDSGRGLALDILRKKALAVQLIRPDSSDAEVAATLFHAGISSSSRVTDVSGRGIGMNAVEQFIEELGGTIRIAMKGPGKQPGFRLFAFEMELPQQVNPKAWQNVQQTLSA